MLVVFMFSKCKKSVYRLYSYKKHFASLDFVCAFDSSRDFNDFVTFLLE